VSTLIVIWFIIIALMVVAGVVFRFLPRRLPAVQLHKVSPKAAESLVGEFLKGSFDGEFGYPSGIFVIRSSSETEIVAQEWVAKGSHFFTILRAFYVSIFALGAEFGCFGMFVCLFIAALFTPALLYAAVAETLLKYLLRSKITSTLERSGDGTKVAFTLRGPVALLVGRRLERAFHQPTLPSRIGSLAGVSAPHEPVAAGQAQAA
jgi:hypothetical protein